MAIVCKGFSPIAGVPHFVDNYSNTEYKITMYYFREVVIGLMRPFDHLLKNFSFEGITYFWSLKYYYLQPRNFICGDNLVG